MQKLNKIILIISILVCGFAMIYSFSVPISQSISLDITHKEIHLGDRFSLTETLYPTYSANKYIEWSSSNEDVVVVDFEGDVEAVGYGEAIVTAKTTNGKTATCEIQVTPRPVTNVAVQAQYTTVEVNYTEKLTLSVTPTNAADTSVVWTTSNQDVVSVDQQGNITALTLGTATIKATANNGLYDSVTFNVVDEVEVTAINFNQTSLTIYHSNTKSIIHTITPGNATNQTLTWTSSHPEVATVSNTGVVTTKDAGTTTITATASNGVTQSCTVTVPQVKASSFYLDVYTTVELNVNENYLLTYTCVSEKGFNYAVTDKVYWSSSKTEVATIDENGIVTAHATGTTLITATLSGISRTILVQVT